MDRDILASRFIKTKLTICRYFERKVAPRLARKNHHPDTLEHLLQKPFFVPNTQRISDLLKKMQKEKVHLAMVTDEYGEVDGVVTIEDILEEIVGDIRDEGDEEKSLITQQKDGSFEVDGSVSIVDFNRHFNTALPEDDPYTSINGLLLDRFEKIPEVGTTTTIGSESLETERVIKSIIVKTSLRRVKLR